MSSPPLLNRRTALSLGGAATLICLTPPANATTSRTTELLTRSKTYDEWYALLDFVPENATIEEIEKIFPERPGSGAHRAYRDFAKRYAQGYIGRSQVAFYLTKTATDRPRASTQALPTIVIYLARILLQAAIRAGTAIYSTLRLIVKGGVYYGKRGYDAFNLFLQKNPLLDGIIIAVSANQVYD